MLSNYAVAVLLAAAAAGLRQLIDPILGLQGPFITLFPTVALIVWYAGAGPAIVTTLLGVLAMDFLFVTPRYALGIERGPALLADSVVIFANLMIIALGDYARRGRQEVREKGAALLATERRFRIALESSATAFTILGAVRDHDDRIVDFEWKYANPAAARLLGRPVTELVGGRLRELTAGLARSGLFDACVQVVRTGTREEGELSYDAGNGPAILRHVCTKLDDGVVLWLDDITASRQAEEALLESQERIARQLAEIEAIYHTAPIGLCVLDRDLRFVRVNQRLAVINRRPLEEHMGCSLHEVVPEIADRVEPVFRQVLSTGQPVMEYEIESRYPEGSEERPQRTWLLNIFPLRDGHGEIIGVNVVAQEITERKRIEAELRESDRRKDEFLAVLAHELRNPLAPIRSAARYLQIRGPQDPDLGRASAIIDRQVSHMARLVDDLLDLSRITRGRIQLDCRRLDLRDVVTAAVESSRPLVDEAGLRLNIRLSDAPVWVNGDLVRLSQVLGNLLNNAARYTPPGGRIEVALDERDGEAVLAVRDTGIGIPAAMLPRIFEMFAQGDRARSRGGLGIGLTLARQLVELHAGRIDVESAGEDQGSTFTVRLPLIGPMRRQDTRRTGVMPEAAISHRVLVADDNADTAESLSMLLEALGHTVRTAHDGQEAVDAVREFQPDVVLLDIGMPELDGYEAARRIRRMPEGRRMRLIALTGWGNPRDRATAAEAGFDQHLTKPVDPLVLADVIGGRTGSVTHPAG